MYRGNLMRLVWVYLLIFASFFLLAFQKNEIGTEQGYYRIDVQFTSPVHVGKNTMKLLIKDPESGNAIAKKLTIEVVPWMAAHEHGIREVPVVTVFGTGNYLVDGIHFSMPGDWEVYLKIIDGQKEDTAVFNVPVAE